VKFQARGRHGANRDTPGANYLIKRFPVSRPSAFRGATKCGRNNCDVIHTLTMHPAPDESHVAAAAAAAAARED